MSLVSLAFVWSAAIVSFIVVRRSRDRSILAATVLFAISLTSNNNGLYLIVDRAAGGRNLVTLGGDLCLIFGTYFLARGIIRAVLPAWKRAELLALIVSISVAVACVALFFQIRMSGSSDAFMVTYGSQPAAALYSLLQISYLGASLLFAGRTVWRNFPGRQGAPGSRVCAGIVVAGCVAAVVLMASVYTMDLAHLAGDGALESVGQGIYGLASPLSIVLVSGGLAAWRVCGWLPDMIWNRQAARLVRALEPVHDRVAERRDLPPARSHGARLHRMVVEIRDASLNSQESAAPLDADEVAEVSRATRLLGVRN